MNERRQTIKPVRRIDGKALRGVREARGYRKSQVADGSGLSRPFYNRLEDGTRTTSKMQTIAQLAAVLDVRTHEITRPLVAPPPSSQRGAARQTPPQASLRDKDGEGPALPDDQHSGRPASTAGGSAVRKEASVSAPRQETKKPVATPSAAANYIADSVLEGALRDGNREGPSHSPDWHAARAESLLEEADKIDGKKAWPALQTKIALAQVHALLALRR